MKKKKGYKRLWGKLFLLLGMVIVLACAVYSAWSHQLEAAENERRALAEARTLSAQMNASWDYIGSIQDQINYTDGRFDFKGVYCSLAGKSIARRFTDTTDYTIRYVRENPRSGNDAPDSFEASALASFASDSSEQYAMLDYEGVPSFRYVSAIWMEQSCLECHGKPAGEKDITGYLKEGMEKGILPVR